MEIPNRLQVDDLNRVGGARSPPGEDAPVLIGPYAAKELLGTTKIF